MSRAAAICVIAAALAGCDAQPEVANEANAADLPRVPTVEAARIPTAGFRFRQQGQSRIFTVTFSARSAPSEIEQAAKRWCGPADVCIVQGWVYGSDVPRDEPATDRQLAQQAFVYSVDRLKGTDEHSDFNCRRYKSLPPSRCLDD